MAIENTPFHRHNGKDAPKIRLKNMDFTGITFDQFDTAKQPLVTSPTGGLTVDQPARDAIDTLITRLEDLGLIESN